MSLFAAGSVASAICRMLLILSTSSDITSMVYSSVIWPPKSPLRPLESVWNLYPGPPKTGYSEIGTTSSLSYFSCNLVDWARSIMA